MPRAVLILPSGTYRAEDFVRGAAASSIDIVVASDHQQAMNEAMGDRALHLDLCDPRTAADAVVAFARRHPVDAVLAVDDQGVEAAALAAAALGLPHNGTDAVAATRDKSRMRRLLHAAGVRQPEFRVVDAGPGEAAANDAASAAAEVGYPAVVKPLSLSASRGVIRVDDAAGARRAAERIRAVLAGAGRDPGEALLVERYVPGDEVAVEALVDGRTVSPLVIFDKPDPLTGPYFEETIYVTPSRLAARAQASVVKELEAAVTAIGLSHGVVHAELRVHGDEAYVLEVAARSIGGLCSRAVHFATGSSLEEIILRHAVGLPVTGLTGAAPGAAGVMMIPIPASGTLAGVDGLAASRDVPLVTGVEITIPVGGQVAALPEGDRYLGFVFATGPEPVAVEEALRRAHACLGITIRPARTEAAS